MKKRPQRICLGCRILKDKRELIRVVRTPMGEIELDSSGKKAGRGAYICPDVGCLKKALKSKGLERSLQRNVPEEVVNRLLENIGDVP